MNVPTQEKCSMEFVLTSQSVPRIAQNECGHQGTAKQTN